MFLTLTILEGVLIITGLFCLRRGGPVILFLLILTSIIDFVNENLFVIYGMRWWKISPNVFYNFYSLFEILCWFIIYYLIYSRTILKGTIVVFGSLVLLYNLLEVFVIYNPTIFHTASFSCFSIVSLCFSSVYIFKISGKVYHNLTGDPVFWICAGAMCFNAVFLVNLFTMLDPDYWKHNGALEAFHILQSIALIIYYIFLCIAFILFYCRRT